MNVRGIASLIWSLLRAELVFRRGALGRAASRIGRALRYHLLVARVSLRRVRSSYHLFVLRYEVRSVGGATARGILHIPRAILFTLFLVGFAARHAVLGAANAVRGRPRASLAAALTLALAVPGYALTAAVLDSGRSSPSPSRPAAPAVVSAPTPDPAVATVPGTSAGTDPAVNPGAVAGVGPDAHPGAIPWTPAPALVSKLEQFSAAAIGTATPDPLPTFAPEAAEGTDIFGSSHAERHANEPRVLGPDKHAHGGDLGK